jgi:hypothetical protein
VKEEDSLFFPSSHRVVDTSLLLIQSPVGKHLFGASRQQQTHWMCKHTTHSDLSDYLWVRPKTITTQEERDTWKAGAGNNQWYLFMRTKQVSVPLVFSCTAHSCFVVVVVVVVVLLLLLLLVLPLVPNAIYI